MLKLKVPTAIYWLSRQRGNSGYKKGSQTKRNLKEEESSDNISYWKKQGPDVDSDAHVYPGVI